MAKLTSRLEVFVDSKYGHDKLIYGVKADVAAIPALFGLKLCFSQRLSSVSNVRCREQNRKHTDAIDRRDDKRLTM